MIRKQNQPQSGLTAKILVSDSSRNAYSGWRIPPTLENGAEDQYD